MEKTKWRCLHVSDGHFNKIVTVQPYSKYTKIFHTQINLHSKFVYFDMAKLLQIIYKNSENMLTNIEKWDIIILTKQKKRKL